MFDLIKAKYEPQVAIAVRLPSPVEASEGVQPVRRARQRPKPKYSLLVLNLLLFICSISLIVYGGIHLNECPAERNIAIGYMTMGALFCVSRLLNAHHEFLEAMGRPNIPPKSAFVVWPTLIMQIVVLGLFFTICYWVYSIKPYISKDPESLTYCEYDYYKNVFWGTTVALVGVLAILILTCTAVCYIRLKKPESPPTDI